MPQTECQHSKSTTEIKTKVICYDKTKSQLYQLITNVIILHKQSPGVAQGNICLKACDFVKKETPIHVFSCEYFEIFQNTYFKERLPTSASSCYKRNIMNSDTCTLFLISSPVTKSSNSCRHLHVFFVFLFFLIGIHSMQG